MKNRQGGKIELLLSQMESSFIYSGCARNGNEALEAYREKRPDLLLVDIQMPVMDGLEFIRKIRDLDEDQAVIVISCHENFYYAKSAMQLGVIDYLIKDLLTKDELYSVLMKAENILDERSSAVCCMDESRDNHRQFQKSNYLRMIAENRKGESVLSEVTHFEPPYSVMCISIDDFLKISEDRVNVIERIGEIIFNVLGSNGWGEAAYYQSGIFTALLSFTKFDDSWDIIKNCSSILNCIRQEIKKETAYSVSAGVSDIFFNIGEVADNYSQAYDLLKYRIFLGGNRTLFSSMQITKIPALKTEKVERHLAEIKRYASENRFCKAVSAVKELYTAELNGILQYNYIQHIHTNLFSVIIDICKNNDISYTDLFGRNYIPADLPDTFNSIDESREWFLGIFNRIIEIRNDSRENYCLHTEKAVSLITENPKITLQELSDRLFINKSYLSRLFKRETGSTVLEYTLKVED